MPTDTLALPDHVIGVRDTYGLGSHDVIYTVEEHTDGSPTEAVIEGVIFGAWSADPPEIELALGTWSGGLTGHDVTEDNWYA